MAETKKSPFDIARETLSQVFKPKTGTLATAGRTAYQKFASRPIPQSLQGVAKVGDQFNTRLANTVKYFSEDPSRLNVYSPQAIEERNKSIAGTPLSFLQKPATITGNYLGNNYVQPIINAPSNVKKVVAPRSTWMERGAGALGLAQAAGTVTPDPIQDVYWPAFNYLKGVGAYKTENPNDKRVVSPEAINAGLESLAGIKTAGIGDVLSTNPTVRSIGNIAELPLTFLAMGKITPKANQKWTKYMDNNFYEVVNATQIARDIEEYQKTPTTWMAAVQQIEEQAKQLFPKMMDSKEMKQLASADPTQYVKTMGKFLEDAIVEVRKPRSEFGLQTKNLRRLEEAGIKPSELTDPLSSLKQEARKYKSAEEFVKATKTENIPLAKGYSESVAKQNEMLKRADEALQEYRAIENMARSPEGQAMSELEKANTFKKYQELVKERDSLLSKATMMQHPETPVKTHIGEKATKSQLTDIYNQATKENIPNTIRVWNKSKFSDQGAYADIPVIRRENNITLYQGSNPGENRQFWTPNKKYAEQFGNVKEKTGSFYKVDNGNRVTDVYVEVPGNQVAKGEAVVPSKPATIKTQIEPQGQVTPLSSQQSGGKGQSSQSFVNPSDPFYNIRRIGVSDQTKQAIKETVISDEVANKISAATGGRVTFEEIKNGAQVSKELDKIFNRQDTIKLGQESMALRNKIASLSEAGVNDEQLTEAIIKDKAFGTFLARLLGQRRIVSDPTKKTIFNKVIAEILKTGVSPEELIKASKGVNFQDPKQIAGFYRTYIKATPGEVLDKLRYSSMLSSPNTWINNATSNWQGTGFLTPIQKTLEGAIDAALTGLSGGKRERTRFAGEGLAYAKGYYSNVQSGIQKMLDTLSGKILVENPDLRNIPIETKPGIKMAMEKLFDAPQKIQESVDQLFKAMTEGGLKESYKYRLGRGVDISKDAADEANRLLFRGELTEKGAGVISNFIGGGAKWVKAGTHSDQPAVRWLAKLTFPFVNTGTNLAKAGLEANPITGLINLKDNEDKIAQVAKMTMGGSVMTLGGLLALSNRLTFGEDSQNRDAYRAAGMQPYSFKVGDKWISYSKLHPLLGFQLATIAALDDAQKKSKIGENTAEIVSQGLFDSLKFYADQTYFKNIGDFIDTVKGADVESLGRFATNYPSQFIPFRAMMGWITRIIDEYQRKPDQGADFFTKSFQQIATQIPGLSTKVPPRVGPSGEPISTPLKDRIINAVNPFGKMTTENQEAKFKYDFETNGLRAWKNYSKLKTVDPEAASQYAKRIKVEKPQLYAQLKKYSTDTKLGITPQETKIRSLGVQDWSRAKAVAKLLSKYQRDTQERKDAVARYRELGIITDEVFKQLKELKKQNLL